MRIVAENVSGTEQSEEKVARTCVVELPESINFLCQLFRTRLCPIQVCTQRSRGFNYPGEFLGLFLCRLPLLGRSYKLRSMFLKSKDTIMPR